MIQVRLALSCLKADLKPVLFVQETVQWENWEMYMNRSTQVHIMHSHYEYINTKPWIQSISQHVFFQLE